ncbi:complex I subunit 4 family protein [Paenibacillus contaminans]|uniref:NADH-quinone oxidoreductase subunit M n=1 Tax=Paenibacillus contaminans TaxID=450362 RepID=A0A329MFB4_9BACL|nr:NADH-quinone oxidoreductase subunit M [Paenibacillus contaminans]RAV17363.1 NADH-quinone oxidoreductase subunit M [Paenibacillus contaminans]
MLANIPILSMIAFSPLLGVLVLLFMPKSQGRWIKVIGIATTLIPLVLATWLYIDFNQQSNNLQYGEHYDWINVPLNKDVPNLEQYGFTSYYLKFSYSLAVDGLSLPMVFLTALIATMAALASVYIKKRWKLYFILFLLLEVGMFGVFMSQDLFLFFVFFEATLIPTFFLVGIWGYMNKEKAANKFLLYNGLGSAVMLLAFLILVVTAGFSQVQDQASSSIYFSGNLGDIVTNLFTPDSAVNAGGEGNPFYMSGNLKWAVFILLLIAFGIKLPILPFHTWMLKVHMEAPPSIVMIHSGILLKMGAYGLIRFGILLFPAEAKEWAFVLALLGLINIVYGAILAFVQKDFKLVLAYSSISHMGVVLLGIAAFNQIGMEGAVFQMVSHGLISALMFLLVGSIYERTQTTQLDKLGGLAGSVPFMSGILLVAGMASLGLPGLSGFVGEFLAFLGLFGSMKVVTVVSALGIILAAVYVLRAVLRITYGPINEAHRSIRDARLIEAIPMITLVAFIILLGVYPAIVSQHLQQTVNGFDQFIQQVTSMKTGG